MKEKDAVNAKLAEDIKLYLKAGGKIKKLKQGESAHDATKYVKRDFVIDTRNYAPLEKKNEKLPRLSSVGD